jgi:hypothetical protein
LSIQQELDRRHEFRKFLSRGIKQVNHKYYVQGLAIFSEAIKLFDTDEARALIILCQSQIEEQRRYEDILSLTISLANEGEFQAALTLLKPVLSGFDREDGRKLLKKLETVLETLKKFAIGLQLENAGKSNDAKNHYQEILGFAPEFTECRIRLAVIAIKNLDSSEALVHLDNINGEQSAYLRGFACVMQRNWRQADKEWRSISNTEVKSQRHSLKTLAQRDCFLTMRNIEQFVESGDLEQAKNTSLQFADKFGIHFVVDSNLHRHIQPLIEVKVWKTQDWNIIAQTAEKLWIENQDITSLHNWAIASYYQAQIDSNKTKDLIIAWSTALANIQSDPSIKDVPWLQNLAPDLDSVSANLIELLEKIIDSVKDKDLTQYLQLRDLHRWQTVALCTTKKLPNSGVRVKQILLSPGCYQRHINILPKQDIPDESWGRLYTNWGQSVAACLEGDLTRAIQIQPKTSSVSVAEKSAAAFVTYHEGCYYLQQYNWRKAIMPFKRVQQDSKEFSNWIIEIDHLFEKQRQKINDFQEHVEFSQFWYGLSKSKPARSYLAEYKVEQIRSQLANEQISLTQGHKQLLELNQIDANNPFAIDLIKKLETIQEINNILDLIQRNQIEEAVRRAKYSKHQEVKYRISEILIEYLLKGAESLQMSHIEIRQWGYWAKEICPYEPAFREIYRSLGL